MVATGVVTTVAGSPGANGSADGVGSIARFYNPYGLTYDGAGNLFIADWGNQTIRKLVVSTGAVTTAAGSTGVHGSTDGVGTAANFYHPEGLATDGAGDLFVTDTDNQTVREISISTGAVTTLAGSPGVRGSTDGLGPAATFNNPQGLAFEEGLLFVADTGGGTIRGIATATGAVGTIVGVADVRRVAPGAMPGGLSGPAGLIFGAGQGLLISDAAENAILLLH